MALPAVGLAEEFVATQDPAIRPVEFETVIPTVDVNTLKGLQLAAANTWQDLNTAALDSTRIPPEMSSLLARILTLSENESDPRRLQVFGAALRGYNAELDMIMHQPGKLGGLTTQTTGPFSAGSWQQIVQVYTVGSQGITRGGGLLVTQHWLTPAILQTADEKLGNYVSVSSSNPEVKFIARQLLRGGIHGGLEKAAEALLFEVVAGQLQPGDRVQISYGGVKGMRLPVSSTDGFVLPVYVRLVEGGHFNSLPSRPFQIVGESIKSVSVVAPSIVKAGEAFDLHITALDKYGNKASGRIPSFDILVDESYYARIESGYNSLSIIRDMMIASPGVYSIKVRSSGGGISGAANPVKVMVDPSRRILWGALGETTDMSTGLDSLEDHLNVARNEQHLDFISISDVDSMIDDWEWEHLISSTERFSGDRNFRVFPGYQRSLPVEKGGGQMVVLRPGTNLKRISQHEVPRLVEFYQKVRAQYQPRNALVVPGALRAGDWRFIDPAYVSLAEIKSAHGFFEWYGLKYLDRGYHLGFAASDEISEWSGNIFPGGLTAVIVDENPQPHNEIFDSLKSARTYVTSGNRLIMDFRVNTGQMGERVESNPSRHIVGEIIGTGPLEWVEVLKNGLPIWKKTFSSIGEVNKEPDSLLLKVEFYSDSKPGPNEIAPPGPAKEWIGFIRANEGNFTGLSTPALDGSAHQKAAINPQDPRRVDFITQTRGNQSGFTVQLSGATENLVLDLSLMRVDVIDAASGSMDQNAEPLAIQQKIAMIELGQGPVRRDLGGSGTPGTLGLEIEEPAVGAVSDSALSFDFIDSGIPANGDYYYLKVRQQNGDYAWSSPILVGGFDLQ